jgi:hypothetical protein
MGRKVNAMKKYAAMLLAAALGTICAVSFDRIAVDDDSGTPPLVAVWNCINQR